MAGEEKYGGSRNAYSCPRFEPRGEEGKLDFAGTAAYGYGKKSVQYLKRRNTFSIDIGIPARIVGNR